MNSDDRERLIRVETTLNLLKTELCGNGQPGRCARHNRRLTSLERWRWMVIGGALVASAVGGWAAERLLK